MFTVAASLDPLAVGQRPWETILIASCVPTQPPAPARCGRGCPRPQPLRIPPARFARDAMLRPPLLVEGHPRALQNPFLLTPCSSFPLFRRPRQNFCIPHGLG